MWQPCRPLSRTVAETTRIGKPVFAQNTNNVKQVDSSVTTLRQPTTDARQQLISRYRDVRRFTETLCEPLVTEDFVVQPIEDVSPPKWHLGHTTWFFEQVILSSFVSGYRRFHEQFFFIFNSYYQAFGNRVDRVLRGTLSRPTVAEVMNYRAEIDKRMIDLLATLDDARYEEMSDLVELGLHHEQQHQELLVTDIKYIFASNPLLPTYTTARAPQLNGEIPNAHFKAFEGGLVEIGATGDQFAYDNEFPRHQTFVHDFALMDRLITCGEYLEFIEDGGYREVDLWLSNAWDVITARRWDKPLFWVNTDSHWQVITASGIHDLVTSEPVCHLSYYEAAAFARWAGKRLPTEFEWEHAASTQDTGRREGNFVDEQFFHPVPLGTIPENGGVKQLFGDVWEWTNSAYLPYPGYRQVPGPLGEYNGKFMNDQMVCRGGSCATSRNHFRHTYRNFFQSDKRWQFTGLRLASDV